MTFNMTSMKQNLAAELKTKLLKAGNVKTYVNKVLEYLEEEERECQKKELELNKYFNENLLAEKDEQPLGKDKIIAENDHTLSQLKKKLEDADVELKRHAWLIAKHKDELGKKDLKIEQLERQVKQATELHAKQLDDKNEQIVKLDNIISVKSQQESEVEKQFDKSDEAAKSYQRELNKDKKIDELQTRASEQELCIGSLQGELKSAETQLICNAKRIQKLETVLQENEMELLTSKKLAKETMIREMKQLELSDDLKNILSSLTKDTAKIADELSQKQYTSSTPNCSTNNPDADTTAEKTLYDYSSDHCSRLQEIYTELIGRFDAKKPARWMFQEQAIGRSELDKILSCVTTCEAAERLMKIILEDSSECIYKCFLTALKKTEQHTISSWISCPGYNIDCKHVKLIQSHYIYLVNNIDLLNSGLINRLFSGLVIDHIDAEQLRHVHTQTEGIDKLLSMLGCKSAQQFEDFLSSLTASGQAFVVKKLTGNVQSASILNNDNSEDPDNVQRTVEVIPPPESSNKAELLCSELVESEMNYVYSLKLVNTKFMGLLKGILEPDDFNLLFCYFEKLYIIHRDLYDGLKMACGTPDLNPTSTTVADCLIVNNEKFLIYAEYGRNLTASQERLNQLCLQDKNISECVTKLEITTNDEGSSRVFRLSELLNLPLKRIENYVLTLSELIKHTNDPTEKDRLLKAMEAMQNVELRVNQAEIDKQSTDDDTLVQRSIKGLPLNWNNFESLGRMQMKGDLEVRSERTSCKGFVFLFDQILVVCEQRDSDSYIFETSVKPHDCILEDKVVKDMFGVPARCEFTLIDRNSKEQIVFGVVGKQREEIKTTWMNAIKTAQMNPPPSPARER